MREPSGESARTSVQSSQVSDQARAAVQQNATQLQRKLAERQKLLSQLDQAKMQEQMNTAMASLSAQSSKENAGTTSLGALLRAKLDADK